MVMNKKAQRNKRRAKAKSNTATSNAKTGPARKNINDARSPEFAHQEDATRYEADGGPIDKEYFEWLFAKKNERVIAKRLTNLSRKLSANHTEFNESIEGSLGDGLA
jgi:hypothetical protein